MAFVLVQIRPVGDKRGSWMVRSSNCLHAHDCCRDITEAKLYVRNLGRNSDHSILLLVHNHHDRPTEAYAIKGESWRNLHLIVRHPKPGEEIYLYPGNEPRAGKDARKTPD